MPTTRSAPTGSARRRGDDGPACRRGPSRCAALRPRPCRPVRAHQPRRWWPRSRAGREPGPPSQGPPRRPAGGWRVRWRRATSRRGDGSHQPGSGRPRRLDRARSTAGRPAHVAAAVRGPRRGSARPANSASPTPPAGGERRDPGGCRCPDWPVPAAPRSVVAGSGPRPDHGGWLGPDRGRRRRRTAGQPARSTPASGGWWGAGCLQSPLVAQSPYLTFDRSAWAALRAATPLTLRARPRAAAGHQRADSTRRGGRRLPAAHPPAEPVRGRHPEPAEGVIDRSSARWRRRCPTSSASPAAWPSARAPSPASCRRCWPAGPTIPQVDLVTTDGFLYPNEVLDERGHHEPQGLPRELRHPPAARTSSPT